MTPATTHFCQAGFFLRHLYGIKQQLKQKHSAQAICSMDPDKLRLNYQRLDDRQLQIKAMHAPMRFLKCCNIPSIAIRYFYDLSPLFNSKLFPKSSTLSISGLFNKIKLSHFSITVTKTSHINLLSDFYSCDWTTS